MLGVFGQNMAVASCQDDREVRKARAQKLGQGDTPHAGHHDIRKHRLECDAVLLQQLQGFFGIGGQGGLIAQILEDLLGEAADFDVVLHDQHLLVGAPRSRAGFRLWRHLIPLDFNLR